MSAALYICLSCRRLAHAEGGPCAQCGGSLMKKNGFDRIKSQPPDAPGEPPQAPPASALPDEAVAALKEPANVFGKFIRIQHLGEGGMGSVWKCYDRELGRWVALKFVEGQGESIVDCVIREAQATAKLSHPNIVQVFEFGRHENLSYIVMQYIEGRTLIDQKVTSAEALEIMRDVALAVEYAHAQGILHRDLKPDNILLDMDRRPYVADFGLARRMEDALSSRSGKVLGTPQYMSPEQAAGRPLDARSDVYSLGATLYYAVTGKPPFDGETIGQVLQAVQSGEPPPPHRHIPSVEPDVETVILKAMEKDPARRYATSAELAGDLQRLLNGEPIRARRPSMTYTLRKKISKNKAVMLAGAGLLATLGFIGYEWSVAVERAEAAKLLEEQKKKGNAEVRHALEYQKGLERWTKAVQYARGGEIDEARKAAREARGHFERADSIVEKAAARHMVGRCRQVEGDSGEARRAWESALELQEGFVKARIDLAKSLIAEYQNRRGLPQIRWRAGKVRFSELEKETPKLAELRSAAEEHMKKASLQGAEKSELALVKGLGLMAGGEFGRAAEKLAEYLKEESWDAETIRLEGWCRYYAEDFAEAERALTEALKYGEDSGTNLARGLVRQSRGDLDGAIKDYSKAIEISPEYAAAYNNRGLARKDKGDLAGAIADHSKAIEIDPRFPLAHVNRGNARHVKGDLPGAIEDYSKAIEINPRLAMAYYDRGIARKEQGDLAGAIEDCGKAIEIDPRYAAAYYNRSLARKDKGDIAGAIEDCSKAIEIDPRYAKAYSNRGLVRQTQGDLPGAIEDYSKAIEIEPRVAMTYYNRGTARQGNGDLPGAFEDYSKAIEIDSRMTSAYFNRGLARQATGDLAGAIQDQSKALELDPRHARAYHHRGIARQTSGDIRGAIQDHCKALELDPRYPEAYANRALCNEILGGQEPARAEEYFSTAARDFRAALEEGGPKWSFHDKAEGWLRRVEEKLKKARGEF